LVYGDLNDEKSMMYLRKSVSDCSYKENMPVEFEMDEYKPLIQKLVLKI